MRLQAPLGTVGPADALPDALHQAGPPSPTQLGATAHSSHPPPSSPKDLGQQGASPRGLGAPHSEAASGWLTVGEKIPKLVQRLLKGGQPAVQFLARGHEGQSRARLSATTSWLPPPSQQSTLSLTPGNQTQSQALLLGSNLRH